MCILCIFCYFLCVLLLSNREVLKMWVCLFYFLFDKVICFGGICMFFCFLENFFFICNVFLRIIKIILIKFGIKYFYYKVDLINLDFCCFGKWYSLLGILYLIWFCNFIFSYREVKNFFWFVGGIWINLIW